MKRNLPLFALSLIAAAFGYAGSARADDITIDPRAFASSASRADVRAELDAFKASGVNPWARNYDPLREFQSGKTRAQVKAEYLQERDAVAAMNGEDSGSEYLADLRGTAAAPVRFAGRRSRTVQQ